MREPRIFFFLPGLLRLALALLLAAHVLSAAEPPNSSELAQGYREGVVLAKPRVSQRATVDAAETRDRVRLRAKFPRLRDLRVIELDPGESVPAAIARLEATGRYEFVTPNRIRHLSVTPNDPAFTTQWSLNNTGQSGGIPGADIKAPAAWDLIREAPNVIVAVVDTGVNLAHQDIAANLWINPAPGPLNDRFGANFVGGRGAMVSGNPNDDGGHGSHVAGIVGALGQNGLGVTGVAWKVQLMAIKVFPATGTGDQSDILAGLNYAVTHGAHIINASFGDSGLPVFDPAEFNALAAARDAGIIVVAAAGNDASNLDLSPQYPANYALDNLVAVGSTTRNETVSASSNFGAAVDLLAPGEAILSLGYTSATGTATLSGTSMSAPHVAGALALLKARFPADSYRQLINRLLRGAEIVPRYLGKSQHGGRLDLLRALRTADDPNGNRPFNDDFASRAKLAGANFRVRTNNAGATLEPGLPEPAGATASLWWEWTPTTTGSVRVTTTGSAYDTVLALYTGTAPALATLATNDDAGTSPTSRIDFIAQAGTTYYIAVAGKNTASGLTLLNLGTVPANDAFASPATLTGLSDGVTATNANASRESGEPRIRNFEGGTSLWYRWIAPRSGRFQCSAVSTDFDPLLAVYTGTTLTALNLISSSDNTGPSNSQTSSLCAFDAVAGTSYLVTVDSKSPAAVGQFTLTVCDALWQAQTGALFSNASALTGAPAVAPDGTVYIGSTDRSLYAFNPDGTRKWSYATGGLIDTCSPAVADDGTVYLGSNDGFFRALRTDGTVKWTHSFNSTAPVATYPVSNSPAVAADGTIYVKVNDGFLYALNPADGFTKWRANVNATTSYASPVVAPDGTIYQGSEDRKLYAFNPDGTAKWTYPGDNDIYTTPALDAAGNLYFSVLNSGWLYSLTPAGSLRWIYKGATLSSTSSPVLSNTGTTVYFAAYDKQLHAVATADGSARWTHFLGDEVRACSPAVDSRGVIYIGSYDFKLYAINPDGTRLRTWSTGNWIRSSPALSGRTLYVGSNDHKLYALDLGDDTGPGTGPWSQYRHNARRLGRALTEPLGFLTEPSSQVALLGRPLTLSVVATGAAPLTFQWKKDGVILDGATSQSFTVTTVTAPIAGVYTVTVTGSQGTRTTTPAVVTVEAATPGRLINLSVRTTAGSGAESLLVGFVVTGAAKPVLVRGIGPGLTAFGVSGTLPDPRLDLIPAGSSVSFVSNNDWSGATLAATFLQVGAFALTPGSRDAALLSTLAPGAYSAQLSDTAGTTGLALLELYDPEPLTAAGRLVNVSARAQVGTGAGVLIAGFVINGNVPKTVLLRAVGPTLASFGVPGVLADPRLDLFRETILIESNDNWATNTITGGTTTLTATFTAVGAFTLASTASRDAVLLTTLAPGPYTAQVSGVNTTTGVVLIEVYEVP